MRVGCAWVCCVGDYFGCERTALVGDIVDCEAVFVVAVADVLSVVFGVGATVNYAVGVVDVAAMRMLE